MKVSIRRVDEEAKITFQETAGLAIITIHRPHKRNALTAEMWNQLSEVGEIIVDNPKNKVVLIRGAGNQFTAGSDIKEFHSMSIEEAETAFTLMEKAISTFEQIPLPTIGVINGPAMGAGLELALACDIRIGSEETKMGIPVGRLGITLNNKFAQRLVNLVGSSRTKDLVYTGRIFDADEAYQLGLLNYLVKGKELDRYAMEKGKLVSSQSPASVYAIKRSVAMCNTRVETPWGNTKNIFVDPHDFPEGVSSFVEKREPKFKQQPRRV